MASPSLVFNRFEWAELSRDDATAIFALRQAIFVVEQNCPYPDIDGKDPDAWHLLCWDGNRLVSYARIFAQGVYWPDASAVGRIVTDADYRGRGLAAQSMISALDFLRETPGTTAVRIAAQHSLCGYYTRFGFRETGKPYDWDDILHVDMQLDLV